MADPFKYAEATAKAATGDIIAAMTLFLLVIIGMAILGVRQLLIKNKLMLIKNELTRDIELKNDEVKEELKKDFSEKLDNSSKSVIEEVEKLDGDIEKKFEEFEKRLIRAKQSQRAEFENVAAQCSVKYEVVAKQEERLTSLAERLSDQEKKLDVHRTSSRAEFQAINTRITKVEHILEDKILKALDDGFREFSKMQKDIALMQKDLQNMSKNGK